MAKTHIKLGEKASSFSCPTTGVSLVPGQVLELTPAMKNSKSVKKALKGGHLEYADSEEVEKGTLGDGKMNREFLEQKNKATLLETALGLVEEGDEIQEADLKTYKKDELIDYILDNQGE